MNLHPLDKTLRNKLERRVKEARDVAEEAARAACKQLGVGLAKPDTHLTDEVKDLRRRLRIHGRQLGDMRDPKEKTQQLDRLVDEIAYEHWHRMLFARFLAENHLLMYPDPDDPVSVSIEDCNDLAADEGAKNGWELAARFATQMLPQIFRVDSPVFSLTLPPENQQQLERLLSDLPEEVFSASDSLGWVYQFWQAKRKDEVNASEVKIGARELPTVTQLFTEPYMVSFLLDNSLGAWWAARQLTDEDLRTAETEQELRDKASLPGVRLEYLRFVWDAGTAEENVKGQSVQLPLGQPDREGEAPAEPRTPQWRPAAGTFDAWPQSLSELKTLDPCCGSGHFLVAALLMLAPMRMKLEGLSAREAVDRVLSENLHGLEIDQRCVELAAFALALAAWRFPGAGGYRPLPDLNVACCGLSVSVAKDDWKQLAGNNKALRIALDWMYDEFRDAPVLGSLLDPAASMASTVVPWDELSKYLLEAIGQERPDEQHEVAVVARGLALASLLMSDEYHVVMTNVPYLGRGKQDERLSRFIYDNFPKGKADLATAFLLRCLDYCNDVGSFFVVTPQNWLFLSSYTRFRKAILNTTSLHFVVNLGEEAWSTFGVRGPRATLFAGASNCDNETLFFGIDATSRLDESTVLLDEKSGILSGDSEHRIIVTLRQTQQLENPDSRIVLDPPKGGALLEEFADSLVGIQTGDYPQFVFGFWEVASQEDCWEYYERPGTHSVDRTEVILWENEAGRLVKLVEEKLDGNTAAWIRGRECWGRQGVSIRLMRVLSAEPYYGFKFDQTLAVIRPTNLDHLEAIWGYCRKLCLLRG